MGLLALDFFFVADDLRFHVFDPLPQFINGQFIERFKLFRLVARFIFIVERHRALLRPECSLCKRGQNNKFYRKLTEGI